MKILMICNTDGALYNFRKPIIEELVFKGHEVYSITSSISREGSYIERLQNLGVKTYIVEFDNSVGIFKNLSIYGQISKHIKIIKPDIVHNFTHKPAIFGSLAARINGVKKIFVSITGLGILFTNDDFKTIVLKNILLLQYRVIFRFVNVIFFQNPDDRNDFVNKKIITLSKTRLTPGSGINVNEFKSSVEKKLQYRKLLAEEIGCNLENKIILLCPARALIEKGINEFYNASKIVYKLSDGYIFIHLGFESHQSEMDKVSLEKKAKENSLYFLGYKSNIQDYMIASDVVVLPSYREGIPRSLLEALALDKYILTTSRPGCKEVVIDDWNGKLFEAKNHKDLASKVLTLSFETLQSSSGNSRKFAENFFDSKIIVEMTLSEYGLMN